MSLAISAKPISLEKDNDGVFRVGGTRVTLDTIIAAFNDGATAEEIVYQYPALNFVDVYEAIGVLPLRVIVPITEWKERFSIAPWIVRLEPDSENGLAKVSAVDTLASFCFTRAIRPTSWKRK